MMILRESTPRAPGPMDARDSDVRCRCGRLVARVDGLRLELKCGRCKRFLVFRVAGDRLVLDRVEEL